MDDAISRVEEAAVQARALARRERERGGSKYTVSTLETMASQLAISVRELRGADVQGEEVTNDVSGL
jgi:hypothetical protein